MKKIYKLWKLKEGKSRPLEFDESQLGTIYELDYEFHSLEISGCGLNGIYVITKNNRKNPVILFNTKDYASGKLNEVGDNNTNKS